MDTARTGKDVDFVNNIESIHTTDRFEGYPLETLYLDSPKDSIKAKGILSVGIGDGQELSLENLRVGIPRSISVLPEINRGAADSL